jgi:hypothetical protein
MAARAHLESSPHPRRPPHTPLPHVRPVLYSMLCNTLGFYNSWFSAGRRSLTSWVWAAPAAPKTIAKGGELRPPPFGIVFWAAGAAQTPKVDDFRPAQQPCIKNLSVLLPGRKSKILNGLLPGRHRNGPSGRPWPISVLSR